MYMLVMLVKPLSFINNNYCVVLIASAVVDCDVEQKGTNVFGDVVTTFKHITEIARMSGKPGGCVKQIGYFVSCK